MGIDKIEIWRTALGLVGSRANVQSATEATRPAQHLNAIWNIYTKSELETTWWNFLTKTRTLASPSEDPPSRWDYLYTYPSDCLTFRYIEDSSGARNEEDPIAFEIVRTEDSKRGIATDEIDAIGVYSENVTDSLLWSVQFCMAIAHKLAVSLALTEIGSEVKSREMFQLYRVELAKAQVLSANEEQKGREREAESIRARIS